VAAHGVQQPALGFVLRLLDHAGAGGHLRHPLGHGQRDEGAAHAEYRGIEQQAAHAAVTTGGGPLIDAEQAADDAQQEQDGDIGKQEQ